MVSKTYMLDRPPRPSPLKEYFDQQVIPAALNAVAPVEAALYRVSERARARPGAALLGALVLGYGLRWIAGHRRARRPFG